MPETGEVEILDYVVVEDGGVLVNPMIVDGQIWGGAAQGIGTALYEEMRFDAQGQPLASTLSDYLLPGPTEVPDIRILHMETPSPYTRFGQKGIGEGGAIAPPAAITNAINDALQGPRRRAAGVADHAAAHRRGDRARRASKARRMKPVAFDYARPAGLGEAIGLLASQPDAKVLAGGQTLGPMLNLRLAQPALLVDITRIAELAAVREHADAITLGATVTHAAIEDGRVADPTGGFLARVARGIAYRAVRTRGTIGGSLAHADPAADWLACLTALGAEVVLRGPARRARASPSRNSCAGPWRPISPTTRSSPASASRKFSKRPASAITRSAARPASSPTRSAWPCTIPPATCSAWSRARPGGTPIVLEDRHLANRCDRAAAAGWRGRPAPTR